MAKLISHFVTTSLLYVLCLPVAHSQFGDLLKNVEKITKGKDQIQQSEPNTAKPGSISYEGGTYVGDLRNGVPHGQGAMTYASGAKYEGQFKDGKPDGQGSSSDKTGKYIGEFKAGRWDGQGTLTSPSGNRYSGGFQNGLMHGQGTYDFADGKRYVGEFKNHKMHGQGTLYSAGGSIMYQGWWCNDATSNGPCRN